MAKSLIIIGLVLVVVGLVWHFLGQAGIPLGKLPGDIHIKGKYGSFYFPVVSCIIISIVLSLIFYLIKK